MLGFGKKKKGDGLPQKDQDGDNAGKGKNNSPGIVKAQNERKAPGSRNEAAPNNLADKLRKANLDISILPLTEQLIFRKAIDEQAGVEPSQDTLAEVKKRLVKAILENDGRLPADWGHVAAEYGFIGPTFYTDYSYVAVGCIIPGKETNGPDIVQKEATWKKFKEILHEAWKELMDRNEYSKAVGLAERWRLKEERDFSVKTEYEDMKKNKQYRHAASYAKEKGLAKEAQEAAVAYFGIEFQKIEENTDDDDYRDMYHASKRLADFCKEHGALDEMRQAGAKAAEICIRHGHLNTAHDETKSHDVSLERLGEIARAYIKENPKLELSKKIDVASSFGLKDELDVFLKGEYNREISLGEYLSAARLMQKHGYFEEMRAAAMEYIKAELKGGYYRIDEAKEFDLPDVADTLTALKAEFKNRIEKHRVTRTEED